MNNRYKSSKQVLKQQSSYYTLYLENISDRLFWSPRVEKLTGSK